VAVIILGPDGMHRTPFWLDGQFHVQVVDPPAPVTGAIDVVFEDDELSRWPRSSADDVLLAELESHQVAESSGPRRSLFRSRSRCLGGGVGSASGVTEAPMDGAVEEK
jgi:hypothetical protein